MKEVKLKKGWLKRQAELARKDIAKWPKWMLQETEKLKKP
jgi:hypothetical protein